MEKTPSGTSVGVEDPYEHAGRCDHLTDDGRCRYALDGRTDGAGDAAFVADRRRDDYRCPVADPDGEWDRPDCPQFRSRAGAGDRACERCGLEERRVATRADRPLLEEHHLSYPGGATDHEITVYLCRWCHAKVHDSWAGLEDDVNPDPEAIAERERRRARERREAEFETAADRYGHRVGAGTGDRGDSTDDAGDDDTDDAGDDDTDDAGDDDTDDAGDDDTDDAGNDDGEDAGNDDGEDAGNDDAGDAGD